MVVRAKVEDAPALAYLHKQTIVEGFLSKLGVGFLTSLYRFIIRREKVFVYKEEGRVVGFVSLSEDAKGMLRRFGMSSPAAVLKIILILFKRPGFLFPMLETARVTFLALFKGKRVNGEKGKKVRSGFLPEAELLSLAVDPEYQKRGIGAELLEELEAYLRAAKVSDYKVIVGENLESANKFYLKHGFEFSQYIRVHGKVRSSVYLKKLQS